MPGSNKRSTTRSSNSGVEASRTSLSTTASIWFLLPISLADASNSDAVRVAAGDALAGIFSRDPQGAGEETLAALHAVVTADDTSLAVRRSVATALGRLDLSPEMRQELLERVRADVTGE